MAAKTLLLHRPSLPCQGPVRMVEAAPTGIPTSQSGLQACSEKPVLLRINPLRARPHANIRQIRSAWVRDLEAKIMEHGWSETHPEFGEFDAHRDSVADLQSNDEEAAA